MSSASGSNSPALSVVVPTHGRTALFLETLSSLERQTLDSFELIVTDDSTSADDRALIEAAVTAYRERTGRAARYLFSAARLGQARNTNQGLAETRGPIVRVLHSDDVLAPAALESEVVLMNDSRLNIDLLYHEAVQFATAPSFDSQRPPGLTLIQPDLFFRSMMNVMTPLPSATVFRRELLDEVGGMREDFDFMCDWDLWIRMIACQRRRHRFIARLSRGYVGWRTHVDSTTGRLWHRHFLEHEEMMEGLRKDEVLTRALVGNTRTRDSFFAAAVRYRYRRLSQDVSHMKTAQLCRSLPMIVRCAISSPSLLARLTPAPWTRLGSRRYPPLPGVPKRRPAKPKKQAPARPSPAPKAASNDPRRGLRFALSAHLAATIIRWGKAAVARTRGVAPQPTVEPLVSGPDVIDVEGMRSRVEIDFRFDAKNANPARVRVLTDYNNTINFWSIRRLINGASVLAFHDINANAFVEPVLHQCLKYTATDSTIEACLQDNQHLTTFGFKSLLERLFPQQFTWVDQSTREQRKVLRYRRRTDAHASVWAPHTGWTFGMLTTGARLDNVERFIQSVEAHCKDPYEILIVSPIALPDLERYRWVRVLHFNQHDDLGWITKKKNLIAEEAVYSDILVCHDRFVLAEGFSEAFDDWGYSYGIAAVRVRLEDGRRGLDWGVVSSQNHVYSSGGLLDYRAYSQYVYVPGGATLIRKTFWRNFPWNDNLFWNEHEDVELCRRVQRAGGIIALASATVIAAEDRWVHLNPIIPFCDQHEVLYGRPVGEQRIHFLPKERAA